MTLSNTVFMRTIFPFKSRTFIQDVRSEMVADIHLYFMNYAEIHFIGLDSNISCIAYLL